MPQSLSRVLLHIVFSTKQRKPWISPAIQDRLHAYLAGGKVKVLAGFET